MLRFGNISAIDVAKGYARVTFLDDNVVSDWLQVVTLGSLQNKFFHTFDINEQVVCLMDDNLEDGVILGAIFSDNIAPDGANKDVVRVKFPDNSSIEYNRNTHEYNIDIKGKINITAESDINITSETKVNITSETASISAVTAEVEATNVTVTGIVDITGATTINGALTVTGAVTVASVASSGAITATDVTASGTVSGSTVTAGAISLGTHKHTGVTTGAGNTGTPTP
jgi:phage baseplate assembly protein V